MASSLLGRINRKNLLMHLFTDVMGQNSSTSHCHCPKIVFSRKGSHFHSNLRFSFMQSPGIIVDNPQSYSRPVFTLQSCLFSTNANVNMTELTSLSNTDRRIISKVLGLKMSYVQDLDISVSADFNQVSFNYNHFNENGILAQNRIYYYLDCFQSKRAIARGDFKELPHFSESYFSFLTFDKELLKILDFNFSKNEKFLVGNFEQSECIVIFDDPFSALAFHQQTKIPTLVIRLFNKTKNIGNNLQNFCENLNQNFQKIYYWSNDANFCRVFRKTCFEYLDHSRVFIINSQESALQLLRRNNKEKFTAIFDSATRAERPTITPVARTGDDLFHRLNDPAIRGVPWSRFPKLTEHLKGHRPGELTIITGPTGCGKTTFASEYSLDLCQQGVPTLWGSFEIKFLDLEMKLMTQFLGKNFDQSQRDEFDQAFVKFAKLPLFFMNFHGQTDINDVLEEARISVLINGVEHIVIDNLQFMLGLTSDSSNDRFYKQDFVLGAIREFATRYKCHVTLVAHPRKEKEEMILSNNSLYGGIKASQEADNILILMNKYHPTFKCNKYVAITKNRAYGSLGVVPLYFDKNTLCYSSYHKREAQQSLTKERSLLYMDELSEEKGTSFFTSNLVQQEKPSSDENFSTVFDESAQEINYQDFKDFLDDQQRQNACNEITVRRS